MVETIKKVLVKLAGNVDKYRVCATSRKNLLSKNTTYDLSYTDNGLRCSMYIDDNSITLYTDVVYTFTKVDIPEDSIFEIIHLYKKLQASCKDYITTKFKEFVDISSSEHDDLD